MPQQGSLLDDAASISGHQLSRPSWDSFVLESAWPL